MWNKLFLKYIRIKLNYDYSLDDIYLLILSLEINIHKLVWGCHFYHTKDSFFTFIFLSNVGRNCCLHNSILSYFFGEKFQVVYANDSSYVGLKLLNYSRLMHVDFGLYVASTEKV